MPWRRPLAQHALAIVLLAATLATVINALTPFGGASTPDSVAYMDVASHIRGGDGWVATDWSVAAAGTGRTESLRWWPPLYPALLALFVQDNTDALGAARLSMVLYLWTALLIYALLARNISAVTAGLVTLALMLSVPVLTVFCYIWSETLFVPIVLVTVLAAELYLEHGPDLRSRALALTLLVVACAASFYTRYVGAGLALMLPMTFLMSQRRRSDWLMFTIAAPAFIAPVAVLCLSNLQESRSITGMARQLSQSSLAENLMQVAQSVEAMLPGSAVTLAVAGVLALATWWLVRRRFAAGKWTLRVPATMRLPLLLASAGFIHLATLVVMRTYSLFTEIDTRYVAPAFLPLALAACLFVVRLPPARLAGGAAWILGFFLLFATTARGYTEFRTSAESWIALGHPQMPWRGSLSYANYTPGPAAARDRAYFRALLPNGAFMVVEHASLWHFAIGVNTAELPVPFDDSARAALHRLPAGSALLLDKGTGKTVFSRLTRHEDYVAIHDLGDKVLVRLSD